MEKKKCSSCQEIGIDFHLGLALVNFSSCANCSPLVGGLQITIHSVKGSEALGGPGENEGVNGLVMSAVERVLTGCVLSSLQLGVKQSPENRKTLT